MLFLLTNFSAAKAFSVENIYQLVNDYRINKGAEPLSINSSLVNAARHRANDMDSKKYFAHRSPDEIMPWQIAEQFGYNYLHIGKNLAKSFSDS